VDKEFGIARYYDADGNLLISSPVGTGLVRGDKSKEGDNKTPTGTYTLSTPE
jgi:murein L,D-transpeptidase YafK